MNLGSYKMIKKININAAILDIVKVDGKDLLVIEQPEDVSVDNEVKGIQYIYIENFTIQDWREDPIGGKHITDSN